jgi:hypothetical protein
MVAGHDMVRETAAVRHPIGVVVGVEPSLYAPG